MYTVIIQTQLTDVGHQEHDHGDESPRRHRNMSIRVVSFDGVSILLLCGLPVLDVVASVRLLVEHLSGVRMLWFGHVESLCMLVDSGFQRLGGGKGRHM
jgi:hypothetical protein